MRSSVCSLLAVLLTLGLLGCAQNAEPDAAAAPETTADAEDGMILYADGDLTGWQHIGDGSFVVEDGLLKTVGGMGLLYYETQPFEGGVLRVEYRNPDSSNAGVFIRIPAVPEDPWDAVHGGYEVQIDDSADDTHVTGVLYSFTEAQARPGNPDDWNVMEITLDGPRTVVYVNDELVTDYTEGAPVPERVEEWEPERGLRPESGYIGLQNHGDEDTVYFREISWRPLEN